MCLPEFGVLYQSFLKMTNSIGELFKKSFRERNVGQSHLAVMIFSNLNGSISFKP